MISPRLWGGIFVAIPTAMPFEPFTRRLGRAEGMQLIQDDIELAIAQMHSLTQPQGDNDE